MASPTPTQGRVVSFLLGYLLTVTKPRRPDFDQPVRRPAEIVDVHTDGTVALHVKLRGAHDFRNVVDANGKGVVSSDEAAAHMKLVENVPEGDTVGTFAWPHVPAARTMAVDVKLDGKELDGLFADFKADLDAAVTELKAAREALDPEKLFDLMEGVARKRYTKEMHTSPDGDTTRVVEPPVVETNGSVADPNAPPGVPSDPPANPDEPPAAQGEGPKPGDVLPEPDAVVAPPPPDVSTVAEVIPPGTVAVDETVSPS